MSHHFRNSGCILPRAFSIQYFDECWEAVLVTIDFHCNEQHLKNWNILYYKEEKVTHVWNNQHFLITLNCMKHKKSRLPLQWSLLDEELLR